MERSGFRIEPQWYWSAERARLEWNRVWTKMWHVGPRVEELAEPGDIMLHSLGHESLMFVRGEDGEIRGFFNVCRHRGSPLLLAGDGPAYAAQFRCPFHGWRYGLDGSLADIPYRERFDCPELDDPERSALNQFRVESFAGWVWFTLAEDTPPLAEYLGPMAPRLAAYGMERAHIVDYKTFAFDCNWKTVLDAFNESYHFQTLHPEVLAWGSEDAPITLFAIHSMMVNEYGAPSALYAQQDALNPALRGLLELSGIDPARFEGRARDVREAVQEAKRETGDDTPFPYATLSDSQLTDAYHFAVFPSAHFNLFPEFQVLMRYRPHPSGDPQKMYFDFIMCAPLAEGEAPPEYEHRVVEAGAQPVGEVLQWGNRTHPVVEEVLGQDVGLVEAVQQGQRSQSFKGPLLSEDERRIAHFHRLIEQLCEGRPIAELIAETGSQDIAEKGENP